MLSNEEDPGPQTYDYDKNRQERKKNAKISMAEFANDHSLNKVDSHLKLRGEIAKLGDAYMWTVYTVGELKKLGAVYNTKIPSSVTRKIDIAKLLITVIKMKEEIPLPMYLDNFTVQSQGGNEVDGNGEPTRN